MELFAALLKIRLNRVWMPKGQGWRKSWDKWLKAYTLFVPIFPRTNFRALRMRENWKLLRGFISRTYRFSSFARTCGKISTNKVHNTYAPIIMYSTWGGGGFGVKFLIWMVVILAYYKIQLDWIQLCSTFKHVMNTHTSMAWHSWRIFIQVRWRATSSVVSG